MGLYGVILALYTGIMEKKMDTTIMGCIIKVISHNSYRNSNRTRNSQWPQYTGKTTNLDPTCKACLPLAKAEHPNLLSQLGRPGLLRSACK